MADVIYLRKSRSDLEIESRDKVDILARHEAEIRRAAARLGRTITDVRREIVSGDSIAARPVMRQLLLEVEAGMWEAVHVVEISRLARGDTMDQGLVARAFTFSNTLIITPNRVYDPRNEADQEYFEFGLFMSRREYKLITGRLQRGRTASLREGKWCSNRAPYGYRREKLVHQKGWTIVPVSGESGTVKDIFTWYTSETAVSAGTIAKRLNEAGVPSPSGGQWTNPAVHGILSNPAYAGWIRWGARASQKEVSGGVIRTSRPRRPNGPDNMFKGMHQPLVTQDVFDRASEKLGHGKSRPGPKQLATVNPLAGLVRCSVCGRSMVRRPHSGNSPAGIICPTAACLTVSAKLETVENAIAAALEIWLSGLQIGEAAPEGNGSEAELAGAALKHCEAQLASLDFRLSRACELAEQGVYDSATFLSRSHDLREHRKLLELKRSELSEKLCQALKEDGERVNVPADMPVIEAYRLAADAESKNILLKALLQKAVYSKTRTERNGSDLEITIYPLFPSL